MADHQQATIHVIKKDNISEHSTLPLSYASLEEGDILVRSAIVSLTANKRLEWGSGVAGKGGTEGGWQRLCEQAVPQELGRCSGCKEKSYILQLEKCSVVAL